MKISLKRLSEIYANQKELGPNTKLDSCCRSNYQCAYWKFQHNETNNYDSWHCDCEYQFRRCLKQLDTSLSNELAFGRSLYIQQCVYYDYPIKQCELYEEFLKPGENMQDEPKKRDIDSNRVRCLDYSLDENQPKIYQHFDMPFNYNGFTMDEIKRLSRNHQIKKLLYTVHGFAQELHAFVKNVRNFHKNYFA